MDNVRIPLSWLIGREEYLKPLWDQFSTPQKVFIKAAYGLPLVGEDEEKAWSMLSGMADIDQLGYITKWENTPYDPQEYSTIVGLIGRRSGKSFLTCFMILYECLFGGHLAHTKKDQDVVVPYVCYDLATAKINMKYISILASEVPKLKKQIVNDKNDEIEFANGIKIKPYPPTVKTGRGIAVPVVVMDEVGFWYKTADNVNPDIEVARALRPAQTQFANPKRFIISTPYTEEGMLWRFHKAGTRGWKLSSGERKGFADTIVMQASTAGMENPVIAKHGRVRMQEFHDEDDPNVFQREYLARFVASESNFIPGASLDVVTAKGVKVRRPQDVNKDGFNASFVGVMDPAFRYDDFAFSIFHRDHRGHVIQDFLHVWSPDRKKKMVLDPAIIMNQIAVWCREYDIPVLFSDQYQLETLKELALQQGISLIGEDFTGHSKAKIYGSLEQMIRTQRIELLDIPDQRMQLSQLNKKLTALGNVQIGAPPGKHDDIATVVALGAKKALEFYPSVRLEGKKETMFEQQSRKIMEKQRGAVWDF